MRTETRVDTRTRLSPSSARCTCVTAKALPLVQSCLEGCKRIYGTDHRETITATCNLGTAHRWAVAIASCTPLSSRWQALSMGPG